MKTLPSGISVFDPSAEQLAASGFDQTLEPNEKVLWMGTPDKFGFYYSSSTNILTFCVFGFLFLFFAWDYHAAMRINLGQPVLLLGLAILQCALCIIPLLLFLAFESVKGRLLYLVTNERVIISCAKELGYFRFARLLKSVRSVEQKKGEGFFIGIPLSPNLKINLCESFYQFGQVYFSNSGNVLVHERIGSRLDISRQQRVNLQIARGVDLHRSIRDISFPRFDDRFVGILKPSKVVSVLRAEPI